VLLGEQALSCRGGQSQCRGQIQGFGIQVHEELLKCERTAAGTGAAQLQRVTVAGDRGKTVGYNEPLTRCTRCGTSLFVEALSSRVGNNIGPMIL
jgi:hypothetical protein